MAANSSYDFIIAGAGAAGLTLLQAMLQSETLRNSRILLIDQTLKPSGDKTWCFWETETLPAVPVRHSWQILEVKVNGHRIQDRLKTCRYRCVRGDEYTGTILHRAAAAENVTLLETEITEFIPEKKTASVVTADGNFRGSYIFQSALRPPRFSQCKVDISLLQHFMGWEISTEEKRFDPEKAILMDFDGAGGKHVCFFYLLPFSEKRALVEYTLFSETRLSENDYIKALTRYIEREWKIPKEKYTVRRTEQGAIPMEDRRYPPWYCKRVLNLGVVGGVTKPSTGYTFTRIHKHTDQIIKALEKGTPLPVAPLSAYRFRVYDMMMLYLMKYEPHRALDVFHDLFAKNSFDRVFQFLGEETGLADEISIFKKFSYPPFFRSIYRMKHRIFTGA